jgi:hypothetical protein
VVAVVDGLAMALVNSECVIKELLTRPELNGTRVRVRAWLEQKERYLVDTIDDDGDAPPLQLSLRPAALQRVAEKARTQAPPLEPHAKVQISHLKSRPELNGTTATVLFYHRETERYEVVVDSTLEKLLLRRERVSELAPPRPAGGAWAPSWRSTEVADEIESRERAHLDAEAAKAGQNPFAPAS